MANTSVSQTPGLFPTQNVTFSEDSTQRLIQHTSINRDMARYINQREVAFYPLVETQTGQQWFNPASQQVPRYGFRKAFSVSDAALTINHGISNITICTYIGGSFTDGTNFYPLPYVSTVLANQIQVVVTPTQILISKGGSAPAISSGILVLEYLKQ